ncbi:MAG: SRPBCC family protein [Dehalococcoidia bacterium]|nr:SRPBCC family protein [Dehalococcoidia bacterium]
MPAIERQITINASPEQVYRYVSDIARHPEWAGHDLKIESTSPGPVAVGSTFTSIGHQMGEHKAQVRVTELQPNSSVVFEAEDDTGHFRHYFRLQAGDGGTLLTKGSDPLRLSLMLKLLMPIGRLYMVPRGLDGDLRRIKARLEASS